MRKRRGREEREGGDGERKGGREMEECRERKEDRKKCEGQREQERGPDRRKRQCGSVWTMTMGIYFTVSYVSFCIWKIFSIKSFKKLLSM